MSEASGSAFNPKAALALVLVGAALFVILLWAMGTGAGAGGANNGGSHAGGKGLSGYAPLVHPLARGG